MRTRREEPSHARDDACRPATAVPSSTLSAKRRTWLSDNTRRTSKSTTVAAQSFYRRTINEAVRFSIIGTFSYSGYYYFFFLIKPRLLFRYREFFFFFFYHIFFADAVLSLRFSLSLSSKRTSHDNALFKWLRNPSRECSQDEKRRATPQLLSEVHAGNSAKKIDNPPLMFTAMLLPLISLLNIHFRCYIQQAFSISSIFIFIILVDVTRVFT